MGKHRFGSRGWVGPFAGFLVAGSILLFAGCGKSGPTSPGDPAPSPTGTSTPTFSPTMTWTPTLTSTPTVLLTPTPVGTPTPCSGGTLALGNRGETGNHFFDTMVTVAFKVTSPADAQATFLQLYKVRRSDPGVAASFRLGIYSDNGSGTAPANLLAVTASYNAQAPPAMDFNLPVANLHLAAGGVYWLAFSTPGGVGIGARQVAPGDGILEMAGSDMPASWGAPVLSPLVPHLLAIYCQ